MIQRTAYQGYSIVSLVFGLMLMISILPLLSNFLLRITPYYYQSVSKLLALSELSFLKSIIEMDLRLGSPNLINKTIIISIADSNITYSIVDFRLKRTKTKGRYISSFLKISSLSQVTPSCFLISFLNTAFKPITVCKPIL
tara:strand:+ start:1577 stop:1999 length:423 start_codon:yes stop_codon:yes gene_type:complete